MATTKSYTIQNGSHFLGGKKYVVGDKIKLTEAQAKAILPKLTSRKPTLNNDSEEIAKLKAMLADNKALSNALAKVEALEAEVAKLKKA